MSLQAQFEGALSVYGNRNPNRSSLLPVHMVAPVDSSKCPAVMFQRTGKRLARDRFHIASSTTSPPIAEPSETATERQPSMASRTLESKSSMLSPCVAQPGMAGTSAQYPPSSARWTMTLTFMKNGGGGGSRTRVRESSPAKTTCVAGSLFRPPHKNRQEAAA